MLRIYALYWLNVFVCALFKQRRSEPGSLASIAVVMLCCSIAFLKPWQ